MKCENAIVITLERCEQMRFAPFMLKFNFKSIKLNCMYGVDGLAIDVPSEVEMENGTYACLLSHIKAIELAKEKKFECVLILEDDVRFVDNFEKRLQACMDELPSDWEVLWLGACDQIKAVPYSENLLKMISSWGAYGYILRDTVYEKLLEFMCNKKLPSDDYYRRIHSSINSFRSKENIVKHLHTRSVRQTTDAIRKNTKSHTSVLDRA